jgi:hypothetical protein
LDRTLQSKAFSPPTTPLLSSNKPTIDQKPQRLEWYNRTVYSIRFNHTTNRNHSLIVWITMKYYSKSIPVLNWFVQTFV